MDSIDKRARAASEALDGAVSGVTPAPFTPRSSRVAPAIVGVAVLLGGAFAANTVLNDSTVNQTVATDASTTTEPTSASTTTTTTTTASAATAATPEPATAEAGERYVFDPVPAGLDEPFAFDVDENMPTDFPSGDFTIEVYGSPVGDDLYANGDIGIMRANFMAELDDLEGEPLVVAGREVFVDTSSQPNTVVNWIEGPTAIGVASWTLSVEELLPTVELLLADPSAIPDQLPNGFVVVAATDDAFAGMSAGVGASVTYVDRSAVGGSVTINTVDDEQTTSAAGWLMNSTAERTELPDGLIVIDNVVNDGPEHLKTVLVPIDDSDRFVSVSMWGDVLSEDDLVAAARSVRPATAAEIEAMADAVGEEAMGPQELISGELADGRSLALTSDIRGFCLLVGDGTVDAEVAPTDAEQCFEITDSEPSTFGADPADHARFWTVGESPSGEQLLVGFPEGQAVNVNKVVVELADGTEEPLERFALPRGWFGEFGQVPVAVVEFDASGEVLHRAELNELSVPDGVGVTIIVMTGF